jgi:hypothetical protein
VVPTLVMDLADGKRDVVDPEVRAYVSSLVTAVSYLDMLLQNKMLSLSSWEVVVLMRMDGTC